MKRDKGILFKHESASARIQDIHGNSILCHVYSRERRQGHATGLMEKVCRYADENNIRLHLFANPYKTTRQSDIPTQDQLEKFYRKFGFIVDYTMPKGWMVRILEPRENYTPYNEREIP